MPPWFPVGIVLSAFPLAASSTCSVPCFSADTTCLPSPESTETTAPSAASPLRVVTTHFSRRQIFTSRKLPEASLMPSGLNASDCTRALWAAAAP